VVQVLRYSAVNLKTSNNPDPDPSQKPDPRAEAAMPWLASPPAAKAAPQPQAPPEPQEPVTQPITHDPNDPDAQNLPPGVVLPEAALFRLGQIKSQIVNFAIIFVFILLWSIFVIRDKPMVGLVCSGIAGAGVLLALLRFRLAKRSYLKQQNR
jgi:hypothetical protein